MLIGCSGSIFYCFLIGFAHHTFALSSRLKNGVLMETLNGLKSITNQTILIERRIFDVLIVGDNKFSLPHQDSFAVVIINIHRKIKKVLNEIDINKCTPLEAFSLLSDLVEMAKD